MSHGMTRISKSLANWTYRISRAIFPTILNVRRRVKCTIFGTASTLVTSESVMDKRAFNFAPNYEMPAMALLVYSLETLCTIDASLLDQLCALLCVSAYARATS